MQSFQYRDGELYCEDVPVAKLAEQFGTPVWVYSKSFLLGQLKQIQTAFAEVDPVICYSVKANSTLGILKVIRDAELISARKEGKWMYYRIAPDAEGLLGQLFQSFSFSLKKDSVLSRDAKNLKDRLRLRKGDSCCVGFSGRSCK